MRVLASTGFASAAPARVETSPAGKVSFTKSSLSGTTIWRLRMKNRLADRGSAVTVNNGVPAVNTGVPPITSSRSFS